MNWIPVFNTQREKVGELLHDNTVPQMLDRLPDFLGGIQLTSDNKFLAFVPRQKRYPDEANRIELGLFNTPKEARTIVENRVKPVLQS